jgi:D-lactate dehydrogenase (cytochrome)
VVEGRSLEDLNHNMEALRAIGCKYGIEISNAAARVMRSKPFNPVRGMLGAEGQRWVPIHSVFPMSEAARVVAASDAYFESQRALIEQHGIILSHLTMTVAGEFFFEPAFYWLDEITPLHRKSVGEDVVAPWLSRPANVAAREAVATLRQGIQAVYVGLGGVNWQIARDYPFKDVQQPSTWALLTSLKTAVDPDGIMNPGSLGFSR